jgi:hypothetical protein
LLLSPLKLFSAKRFRERWLRIPVKAPRLMLESGAALDDGGGLRPPFHFLASLAEGEEERRGGLPAPSWSMLSSCTRHTACADSASNSSSDCSSTMDSGEPFNCCCCCCCCCCMDFFFLFFFLAKGDEDEEDE